MHVVRQHPERESVIKYKTLKRKTLTHCFRRQVHLLLPSCSKNFFHGMDKSTKRAKPM